MSDSIIVRVTLDSYDMASAGKQTQVYVQVPEVARVSWLLPADVFHGLKDRAWPEVLDVAHDYITYGGAASNSSSTAAWSAIRGWLRDDANRDEMQVAFEEHHARQDPVVRKLLARVKELEEQRDRRRVRLIAAEADLLEMRGLLSPNGFPRRIPSEVEIHERVAPAVEWLLNRVAELEAAPKGVFRASHDSIAMGLYTTAAEARKHCEAEVRREHAESSEVELWWREDEDTVDQPEDGEQELFEHVKLQALPGPGRTRNTGYLVTPLEVASEYDEEADE